MEPRTAAVEVIRGEIEGNERIHEARRIPLRGYLAVCPLACLPRPSLYRAYDLRVNACVLVGSRTEQVEVDR